MGRYKNLLSLVTLSVMVFGLSIVASAQWRDNRRGNNGNNGYYGNNYNLKSSIKNLKNSSDRFEDILDRELDRSRYDGTRREDNLNELAERFKRAANKLDDEYRDNRGTRDSYNEARNVINYGSQLDRALTRSRLASNSASLRNSWNAIERDLLTISRAYNISYNGQFGRNRGYGNDNGNNGRNNRNTRGNNGNYNRNLRATIVSLKNKSSRFEDRVDRTNNNDRYGRRSSNNLENLTNRFNDAVKDLEREYDNARDYNDSYDEVRTVLSLGEQVDREISRDRDYRNLQSEWNSIEQDLRTIANAFNLRYSGRNGGNGAGIGDIIRNFPF